MQKLHQLKEIVIVFNGGLSIQKDKILVYRSNKPFVNELNSYFNQVTLCGFVVNDKIFSNFPIPENSKTKIKALGLSLKHNTITEKLLNYTTSLFRVVNTVRSNQFFYIFLPGHLPFLFAIVCLFFRKRYALYVRGDWQNGKNVIMERIHGILFRNAEFILTTGKNYAEKILTWNKNTEQVIPMIEVTKKDIYSRTDYKLKNPVKLLFLSRIETAKGIFELLSAFESLVKEDKNLRLIVAGGGPDFARLETLCRSKAFINDVSVLGLIKTREKVEALYKDADIFIFPSYHEGFPRVLYEAMTFGVPIITTFVGGINGVMEAGVNCLKVQKQNPEDLKSKISTLLCDESLRKKIGQGGTLTIARLFDKFEQNTHAKQVIEWFRKTTES